MAKVNYLGEKILDPHCESLNLERTKTAAREATSKLRRQREQDARARVRQELYALMGRPL